MPYDKNLNSTRGEIQGISRLLLANNAASPAAVLIQGYEEFGDIITTEMKGEMPIEAVIKPVVTPTGAIMRQTGGTPGLITLGYECMSKSMADIRKMTYLLMGILNGDLTQAAVASSAADAIVFSGPAPAILNVWYPIQKTAARVRSLTAFAIAGMVEGIDFVVDKRIGMVRFTNPATLPVASVTPTITATQISATSTDAMKGIAPLQGGIFTGYGSIYVYDSNKANPLAKMHENFSYQLTPTAWPTFAHDKQAEAKFQLMITADEGQVYLRN